MNKQKYISEYNKQAYYSLLVRIPKRDEDIVNRLKSSPSKNGYVLNLLQEDIHPSILKLGFIKQTLKGVLVKHGIRTIYLFGSYARGEATKDSDVDILCDKGDISSLLEKELLEEELQNKLGKKVDLVFLTADMPEYFKEKIKEDLIELC